MLLIVGSIKSSGQVRSLKSGPSSYFTWEQNRRHARYSQAASALRRIYHYRSTGVWVSVRKVLEIPFVEFRGRLSWAERLVHRRLDSEGHQYQREQMRLCVHRRTLVGPEAHRPGVVPNRRDLRSGTRSEHS